MASNGVGRAAPERTFGTDRAEDCRVLGPGSEGPGAPSRSSRSLVIRTATQPSVTYPPQRVCAPLGSISSSRQQDHVRRIPRRGPVDIRVVEAHRGIGAATDAADDRPHLQSPSCGKPAAYDKPCEWNDTTLRQHSVFENPPNQPTACSTYRPDPVSVYKSTRPN